MMKKRIVSLLLAAAMAAALLVLPAEAAEAVRFSDVKDRRTSIAVESLRLMGVLDGYGDGTFRPDVSVNRAQFCKMVVYAMGGQDQLGLYKTITIFPDVKPSHWAAGFINMVARKGIISGYADGRFHPEQTVTLGQAVTILMRLLGYKDEDIGGIWPASYMAEAASIGLTERVGVDGNVALTRSQAAELFLNLLRMDTKDGISYISSIGAWTYLENEILLTSSAIGDDGRATAMRLTSASSLTYQMAGDKVSNGALDGCRGTLLLNKRNKVITFIPADLDQSITITVSHATATQITDVKGESYRVEPDTWTYYNGQVLTWTGAQLDVFSWVTAGTTVTLYMDIAGKVDRVLVGGGSTANSAVIVYDDGSTAGFADLAGGATGYKIYKNGAEALAKDIQKYDVATYSPTTNSIRVCDTRISGYYESCEPNPDEPRTVHLLGCDFPVLATAQQSVSKFKPGDQMVLLLTEDNQVAGAVEAKGSVVSGNAIGIVRAPGQVDLLCGITLKGDADDGKDLVGQMVRVSSASQRHLSLSRLSGGNASGNLDVAARTMGQRKLADNVMIFQNTIDGVEAISLNSLTDAIIPAGRIVYARVNSANKVDLILINSGEDGTVLYGRVFVEVRSSNVPDDNGNTTSWETIGVEYGNGQRTKDFRMNYSVNGGDYVAVTLNRANTGFSSLKKLEETKDVPNSAWTSQSAVTAGGRTYTVPSSVLCYNSDMRRWVSLSEAHSYADKCNIYTDGGYVRCIEVSR